MSLLEIINKLALIRIQGSNWVGFSVFVAMNLYSGIFFLKHGDNKTNWDKIVAFFSGFVVAHFFIHISEASTAIPIYLYHRSTQHIAQLTGLWWWQWTGAEFLVVWNWRKYLRISMLGLWFPLAGIYAAIVQQYFGTTGMNTLIGIDLVYYFLFVYVPNWLVIYIVYTKGFFRKVQ